MNINSRYSPVYVVVGLLAVYLIIKWTCRLIFGLLDYALLIGIIVGVVWYIRLPREKRARLNNKVKARINSIFN